MDRIQIEVFDGVVWWICTADLVLMSLGTDWLNWICNRLCECEAVCDVWFFVVYGSVMVWNEGIGFVTVVLWLLE